MNVPESQDIRITSHVVPKTPGEPYTNEGPLCPDVVRGDLTDITEDGLLEERSGYYLNKPLSRLFV